MVLENEDLRLSLSLSTSESRFPVKLTLFPSLTMSTSPSKAQGIYSDEDEEAGARSPVSTLSGSSGKRSDREEFEGEDNSSKKLRLSKEQTVILEKSFKDNCTLNLKQKQKQALAKQLNLRPRQVEVWFQNRRARSKLKQTEVESEYLQRWCQKLAEENKRLQKEVMELRAAAANSISLSSPMQLLLQGQYLSQQYHLNSSCAADSNSLALYFRQ